MSKPNVVECPSQWEAEVLRDLLANIRLLNEGDRVTFVVTCQTSGWGGSFGLYNEQITLRSASGEIPVGGQSQPYRVRIDPTKE